MHGDYKEEDLATKQQLPRFSHPAEEMFARVLDFYGLMWLYEPRTFALERDNEGNVTEGFSPDFYLPEHERCIRWDDPDIGIAWPLADGQAPLLSAKDAAGLAFKHAEAYP